MDGRRPQRVPYPVDVDATAMPLSDSARRLLGLHTQWHDKVQVYMCVASHKPEQLVTWLSSGLHQLTATLQLVCMCKCKFAVECCQATCVNVQHSITSMYSYLLYY